MNNDVDVPSSQDELVAILQRFTDDLDNEMPEPARLRDLADESRRRDLVTSLLQALTPSVPEPGRWQKWFDGGPSPREALDLTQFARGADGSGRKIQNAAGAYDKATKKVRDTRTEVANAQERLQEANEALAAAEEGQRAAAARAQGAILWALLREVSKRSDAVFAAGPAWLLIRVVSSEWAAEESRLFDEDMVPLLMRARDDQTNTIAEATTKLAGDAKFERALRLAIFQVCKAHLNASNEGVPVESCLSRQGDE